MVNLRNPSRCRQCPRLQEQFKQLRISHPDYWNRPVLSTGDQSSPLLIVGLAPGKHGANKTGIPFTGDSSGTLLFKVLQRLGIEQRVRITNAVKCLPVQNKPTRIEILNCQKFLKPELIEHPVILALGHVAHKSALSTLGLVQNHFTFSHGAIHNLEDFGWLVDSYHCSRYNTQTGRLTEQMLYDAIASAAKLSSLTTPGNDCASQAHTHQVYGG